MKKRISLAGFFMVFILLVVAGTFSRADDPPQIDKGWNLISVTCDSDLDQFRQKLGNDEILVFDWNGSEYVQVDRLLRGHGYSLNSNAVLSSSNICGGQTEAWTTTVSIHKGWNLIGNPYHQPTVISELLGEHAGSFSELIYAYQGNKYKEITKSDKIKVWRAVWVYSYVDLELEYEIDCQALTIELTEPETAELEVGDAANFSATCHLGDEIDCGDDTDCGTGWSTAADVTGTALWRLSDMTVLALGEAAGSYTAAAPGSCGVNAEYGDLDSNTITVTVAEPEPVLVGIELIAVKYELEVGETTVLTVNGLYSDGTVAEVTDEATFAVAESEIGAVEGNIFSALAAGETDVTATVGDLSDSITMTVIEGCTGQLAEIYLYADKTELDKGETTQLNVDGRSDCGSELIDMTDEAVFLLNSGSIGFLSGNVFTGMSPGTVLISANVGDLTDSVSITVTEPGKEIVSLDLYGYPRAIEIYETAVFYVYARYSDGSMERVTQQVEWVYDGSMGRIESNGMFYPAALGKISAKALLNGLESNTVEIDVLEKQLIWIGIFPEPNNNLKPLPCPENYGYYSCYNNNYIQNGNTGRFYAVGDFNNETRQIVTDSIEMWESTDDTVLSIAAGGNVTAHKIGTVGVRAYKEGVYSEWAWVQVIDASTQEFLLLEYSNRETILQVGDTTPLNATYYSRSATTVPTYSVHNTEVANGIFTSLRVTAESSWTVEDTAVGTFDAAEGVFSGIEAGTTDVYAQYSGLTSNSVEMEVWKPDDFQFCGDPEPEATWTDNKTVARLAVDCETYNTGDEVAVSFDALLSDYVSRRVLDVCLDMYIYNSDQELVKTVRHENCSPTPLFRTTLDGYTPVYNYSMNWDQNDDTGAAVPPGDYIAVARFYILYCPVLKVPFTITGE